MFTLTPGSTHDSTAFDTLLMTFLAYIGSMKCRRRLKYVICDKGYDCKRIVELCVKNKLIPVIPKRRKPNGEEREGPGFDKKKYKERNLIERCIGWLKENRRIATRYEKLAITYRAMVQLGAIRRMLRTA